MSKKRIWVCKEGPTCCTSDCPALMVAALNEAIERLGAGGTLEVCPGGCMGMCKQGPTNIRVKSGRSAATPYCHTQPGDAEAIVRAHMGEEDKPVERLRYRPGAGEGNATASGASGV